MRMSCLITTLNPMTDVTNPARLTQSLICIFIGSSAVIFEKGRATFTLFPICDLFLPLCDTTLCAGRGLRAGVVPLSAIPQPPHQPGGWCSYLYMHAQLRQVDAGTGSPETSTADEYSNPSDSERQPRTSSSSGPAPTTLTDRLGPGSHLGDQAVSRLPGRTVVARPSGCFSRWVTSARPGHHETGVLECLDQARTGYHRQRRVRQPLGPAYAPTVRVRRDCPHLPRSAAVARDAGRLDS
jgi:hypothetical protein